MPCGVQGAHDEATPPHWELYDLTKDPGENTNLAGDSSYTEVFKQLKKQLISAREEVGDLDPNHPEVSSRLSNTAP
ncbi:MAG: hypothetical protein ACI9R3_003031 [Verrucomicrobiales bacterium]